MTCMNAFAPPMAMATTQLARVVQCPLIPDEDAGFGRLENQREGKTRMSWVVVTGQDGTRGLRILWR